MSGEVLDEPVYPDIEVQLTGEDDNGFSIVSRVGQALRRGGVSEESINDFREEATRGSYEHLLAVVEKWVTVS